jgi:hypothetical protein
MHAGMYMCKLFAVSAARSLFGNSPANSGARNQKKQNLHVLGTRDEFGSVMDMFFLVELMVVITPTASTKGVISSIRFSSKCLHF